MPAVDHYLEAQVLTAPPEQLHMLVVDGALRHARLGLRALGDADYELSHESFSRSREFVNELISGLSPDGDPELIQNLQGLFGFVHRSLVAADGKLYVTDRKGDTAVLLAGPRFELIAKNSIGEPVYASVVVSDGELLLRSYRHLWCVGGGK